MKLYGVLPVPRYLSNWQEAADLALMTLLVVMLCTEPIMFCLEHNADQLFTSHCREGEDLRILNSNVSMCAVFLYYLLLIDLAVFSNRVSAYILVCNRMLAEVALFVLAIVLVLMTFSSGLSCLHQDMKQFNGIHHGAVALWELFLNLFGPEDYEQLQKKTLTLIMSFVFLVLSIIFLSNLLIAQLICAYETLYADMVGYARITRCRVIVETMPLVPSKRWLQFVASIGFERKIEFNEGDVGVNNGIATTEPASANPTTVDLIKRFGGSTSPDMKWPTEELENSQDSDKFERLETLIKRAMELLIKTRAGKKQRRAGAESSAEERSAGAVDEGSQDLGEVGDEPLD